MTPSQARNAIKRSLKALIDPKPNKAAKEKIWQFFDYQCAYCASKLSPKDRNAHIDHVIAEADGGSNQLCNLILTCAICNGDEKREMDWQTFLLQKCQGKSTEYHQRYNKIIQWFSEQPGSVTITDEQQAQLDSAFDLINKQYSHAVEQLRKQYKY